MKYRTLLKERIDAQLDTIVKLSNGDAISSHIVASYKAVIPTILKATTEELESACIDLACNLFAYDESQAKHCRSIMSAITIREELIAAERKVLNRIKEACDGHF